MPAPSLWPGFSGLKFQQHFTLPQQYANFTPRVDVFQTEQHVIVKVELPGITGKDRLAIRVTAETVTIHGEIKPANSYAPDQCCCQECYQGTFLRVLTLPTEVCAEQAQTDYVNGILTIAIPQKPGKPVQGYQIK